MRNFFQEFSITIYSFIYCLYVQSLYLEREPREEEAENLNLFIERSKNKLHYNTLLILKMFQLSYRSTYFFTD